MKLNNYITTFFIIYLPLLVISQNPIQRTLLIDTIPPVTGTGQVISDSTGIKNDTVPPLNISPDAFDIEIDYGARDTQWVDVINSKIHLYGDAFVRYGDYEIKAGYVIFDFEKKEAFAQFIQDSLGREEGTPTFFDGNQQFSFKRMRYNFNTNKGIVYDAVTQQGQLYIHGSVTKFISQESDTIQVDDQIFNKDALVTTCELAHPHYGIRTSKLKIVPDKLAVIGPARLEIAGIPTPLFIPFAFMPIIQGQRSGIIFGGQQGFEFSPTLGFGFREIGYYVALSDYADLRVTGDIYSRGTWGLRTSTNYAKRYKYRGNLQLGYAKQIIEQEGVLEPNINKSFSFALNHNQDSKFHPYMELGGNLRFTTNDYARRNFNDAESQLENIINSNFRFSHSLPSVDALSLSASISHSQNTRTRRIDFTFPDLQLRMKTIYPFKSQGPGQEKWYEKINMSYNAKLKNYVSTFDTILFTQETLDKLQTGISHDLRMGASFTALGNFTVTPSMDYQELWFFKSLEKAFDPTLVIDTIAQDTTFGTVNDNFNWGFKPYRDFNMGFNISTNVFGTLQFAKGWLRGLRHIVKPSIGFSYRPSTERYYEFVQTDTRDSIDLERYNPFSGGIFGTPVLRQRQMALTYGVNNIFEGKYYSKKDSTEKKFKLFDNISLNGNYNFAADSLRWSQVNMRGTARFFSGFTTLTVGAVFDPYMEENNRRINKTVWSERKRLLRLESFTVMISTGFTINQLRRTFSGDQRNSRTSAATGGSGRINTANQSFMSESLLDMLDNFRISHVLSLNWNSINGIKEFNTRANSIRIQGSIPLTTNWSVNIGNFSYDFVSNSFGYPSLGLSRDLHCWNFNFSWQPQRGTYTFFIGVKTSQLAQLLKYNYGRNQFDALF